MTLQRGDRVAYIRERSPDYPPHAYTGVVVNLDDEDTTAHVLFDDGQELQVDICDLARAEARERAAMSDVENVPAPIVDEDNYFMQQYRRLAAAEERAARLAAALRKVRDDAWTICGDSDVEFMDNMLCGMANFIDAALDGTDSTV